MDQRKAAEAEALSLEENADQYDQDEFLREAAEAWHEAGNHDRAVELLTELIALGGEEGDKARVTLADVLFDAGRRREAWAELDALREDQPDSPEPYHLAGDLMQKRGRLDEALAWYDLMAARIEPDELDENVGLLGRRQVRQRLGLPLDRLDKRVGKLYRWLEDSARKVSEV